MAPGRVAINLVAGGGPDTGYGAPPLDHAGRYARLGRLADALRARFPGPLYLGGASEDALALAARAADTYLMWGEPPEAIAARAAAMRERAGRRMRVGLRLHLIARATDGEARAAAAELLSRAEVAGARAAEYAAFDSVGQGAHERHPGRRGRLGRARPVGGHPRRARRRGHGAGGLLRPGGAAARRLPRRRR